MRDFLKRKFDYFISYSRKDGVFANALKDWLVEKAGLRVWFDEADLASGERISADIARSISQCRGVIFLLSKDSLKSKFVQDELDQALAEKKEQAQFQMVLLRLDDCDVTGQCKQIRHLKWHELAAHAGEPHPCLSLQAATEILCRVYAYDGWNNRQEGKPQEVYVSRGWRDGEEAFADDICRRMAALGLRLVGDLPDQPSTDADRIKAIMRHCSGHACILPPRTHAAGPAAAYKYFLQEIGLSQSLSLPRIVLAGRETSVPERLASEIFWVEAAMLRDGDAAAQPLINRFHDFKDELIEPKHGQHAFFAS